jgi:hypothetical protein
MLFSSTYGGKQVVSGGAEIHLEDMRSLSAQVGLALAAADTVVLDLSHTKRVDSWSLLAISDLLGKRAPRLSVTAPEYLRATLSRLG